MTESPDWTSPDINVHRRIISVMAAIKGLSPEGQIAFGSSRYKYITEKQLTSAVREQMIRVGLVAVPVNIDETVIEKNNGYITRQTVTYRIFNAYNPSDCIDVVSTGQGFDSGDKGSGKASTNAYKYMLFRVFEIPQSEDPDDTPSEKFAQRTTTITSSRPPAAVIRRQQQEQGVKPNGS